jgi:hypothetical protein
MARARKARIPGLIRKPPEMVSRYELGLKLSGKVRPAPEQLAEQKAKYSMAVEVIQPPEDVVELARSLASGSDKIKLLNLWRRAKLLKVKVLNLTDTISGIREIIEKNNIPRNWAEPMLAKAGYTPNEIRTILDRIYGAGGVVGAPGAGAPPGM